MNIKTISNSGLTTYDSCPLKYHYSYVRGIWPEITPKAFAIGSAVHKVLAALYTKKIKNESLKLTEASNIFLASLKSKPAELGGVTEEVLTLKYQGILKKILSEPLDLKPVQVEKFYEVDFIHPLTKEKLNPRRRGIIDVIAENDVLVEHKTSSKKYTPADILKSYQHVGYFVDYWNLYKRRPTKVLYDIIYKVREPLIDVFEVIVSDSDINKYFRWAKKIINAIEKEKWPPKPEYLKCRFCSYSNICTHSKF